MAVFYTIKVFVKIHADILLHHEGVRVHEGPVGDYSAPLELFHACKRGLTRFHAGIDESISCDGDAFFVQVIRPAFDFFVVK